VRRYHIKLYDRTTSGAIVCEGEPADTHHGTPFTYIGAKIYCRACKSEGVIVGAGPRLHETTMGKEVALSDDLGACKCEPTPRLIASQYDSYQDIDTGDSATMSSTPSRASMPNPIFDQQFTLLDQHTKKPLANIRYRARSTSGAYITGTTDAEGRTARFQTPDSAGVVLEVLHER
jgi:hypothetical protein